MAKQRKRESRYPHRLQGTFVSEDTYEGIKEVGGRYGKSTAQVIRGVLDKGLGPYLAPGRTEADEEDQGPDDVYLFETIEGAATELGMRESEVVRGAIERGLEEFLFMARGRRFHERNVGGRALSDDVLRRLLLSEDALYNEEGLEHRLEEVKRSGLLEKSLGGPHVRELWSDPSAFCHCCGQYVRKSERGSDRDKRLEVRAVLDRRA